MPAIKACAIAAVLFAAGCGGGPTLHAVKGKVTLDGNPMTAGSVRFVPDKAKGNQAGVEPTGAIGSDGTYTLMTNGKSGAPAGWYKVTVASGEIPNSVKPKLTIVIAPRYGNPELTDLSVEVAGSSAAGAHDLKVASR